MHVIHAMVGLREQVRQPDRGHLTQAQPLSVGVRQKVRVQQVGKTHTLHVRQQQRDAIHPALSLLSVSRSSQQLIRMVGMLPDLREP